QVLRMPAASDTSEMKTMYGNVMRSNSTVNANFPGSAANPGAVTYTISVAAPSIRSRTSDGFRFFCSARIGTKACENAPSANRRRSRFGILNATKKASVARLAPNSRAMKKSRAKPSTRETNVRLLIAARARSRLMLNSRPFSQPDRSNGQYRVGTQARPTGAQAPRTQHEPAHCGTQCDQGRQEGDRIGQ